VISLPPGQGGCPLPRMPDLPTPHLRGRNATHVCGTYPHHCIACVDESWVRVDQSEGCIQQLNRMFSLIKFDAYRAVLGAGVRVESIQSAVPHPQCTTKWPVLGMGF